jgi:hypothetical protein
VCHEVAPKVGLSCFVQSQLQYPAINAGDFRSPAFIVCGGISIHIHGNSPYCLYILSVYNCTLKLELYFLLGLKVLGRLKSGVFERSTVHSHKSEIRSRVFKDSTPKIEASSMISTTGKCTPSLPSFHKTISLYI